MRKEKISSWIGATYRMRKQRVPQPKNLSEIESI
jgi:hypothetical protein